MKALMHAMAVSMFLIVFAPRSTEAAFLGLDNGDYDITLFDCPFTGGMTCTGFLHVDDYVVGGAVTGWGTDWDFDLPALGVRYTDPRCDHIVFNDVCTEITDDLRLTLFYFPEGEGGWEWEVKEGGTYLALSTWEASASTATIVPEPSTLVLVAAGVGTIWLRRRHPRKRRAGARR